MPMIFWRRAITVCIGSSSGMDGEIHRRSSAGDPKSGTSTGVLDESDI